MTALDIQVALDEFTTRIPMSRLPALRLAFESRTGAFTTDDSFFETRMRAFLVDAWTREVLASDASELRETWRPTRHQRGLYEVLAIEDQHLLCRCLCRGVEFRVHKSAGYTSSEPPITSSTIGEIFSGFVAVAPTGDLACLPGPVFHPSKATQFLRKTASTKSARADDFFDAILRIRMRLDRFPGIDAKYVYTEVGLAAPDVFSATWR